MIVDEIIPAVIDVTGYVPDDVLFERLSDALDILAAKGDWDGLTGYLDIFPDNKTITLPDDVLSPIKLLINDNPSFSRSQIYEFTMNGPGPDMREVNDWSWMDNQYSPVMKQPAAPSPIVFINDDSRDLGVRIDIRARDEAGETVNTFVTLGPANQAPGIDPPQPDQEPSPGYFKYIDRIHKPVTVGRIRVKTAVDNMELAHYLPYETDPQYRQIRISNGDHIKILYKRRTYRIQSRFDFIPIKSKMAIIMAVRALESYRKAQTADDIALGDGFEKKAVQFITEEQQSRHTAETNAQQTEVQPCLDLNYNNADSLIVADIYDDACRIFGYIGRHNVFDRITDSIKLMNGKCLWDAQEGYVDLLTTGYEFITLPRFVDNPLAINIGGRPKAIRNEWYEFHLNGPGSDFVACNTWHFVGEVPIIRPLPGVPASLLATADRQEDAGKQIRVFGWDENGNRVFSEYRRTDEIITTHVDEFTTASSLYKDGVAVTIQARPTSAPAFTSAQILQAPKITRIDRIEKDPTVGFVHLNAFFPHSPSLTTAGAVRPIIPLGYYHPDETEPNYVQIRIPKRLGGSWIRMRYRKRQLKVSSLTDPIHLKSPFALVMAMQAVKAATSDKPDLQTAQAFEDKAEKLLKEEMDTRRPPGETFSFQFEGIRSEVIL